MLKNRGQAILLFFFLSFFSFFSQAQVHVSDGSFVFIAEGTQVSENFREAGEKTKPADHSHALSAQHNASDQNRNIVKGEKSPNKKKKDVLKTRQCKAKSMAASQNHPQKINYKYNSGNSFSFSISDSASKPVISPDNWGKWFLVCAVIFLKILSFKTEVRNHYYTRSLLRTLTRIFYIRPPPVA